MSIITQSPLNLASNDRFSISIGIPEKLLPYKKSFTRGVTAIDGASFDFSLIGANVPLIQIPAIEIRHSGADAKVSSHTRNSFDTLKTNFLVDNQFRNYMFIYSWLKFLNHDRLNIVDGELLAGDNLRTEDLTKYYMTEIKVTVSDEYLKPVMSWTYHRAFPVSLGGVDLTRQNPGQIELTAEFAYSQISVQLYGEGIDDTISFDLD